MMQFGTILISLTGILLLALPGCKSENDVPDRIIPYILEWEIPSGLNSIETHFFEFNNVRTQVDEFFPDENFTLEDIEVLRPRQAKITLRDPSITFNDIRSVEVHMRQKQEPFTEYEVFYTLNLRQRDKQEIRLLPTLTNVKSLFAGDRMEVTIRINFYRISARSTPVLLEMELEAFR